MEAVQITVPVSPSLEMCLPSRERLQIPQQVLRIRPDLLYLFPQVNLYVDILMDAATKSSVSPYVLAAMILQEQGVNGGTPLISGKLFLWIFRFITTHFNVEAYQSGSMSATQMGLRYASQSGSYGRPWNTVEKSILGGAQNYGDNYVKAGQNTFYLKKFNVQGSNPYKHQYMSNVQGAASEAERLSKAYSSLKNSALEFYMPLFNNMGAGMCCTYGNGSPNNKLSGLNADGFSLTPSFGKDTLSYNLIVDTSVTSIQISASTADGNASVAGTGNIELTGNSSDIAVTVTAQNGSTRTFTIHVVRQAGGATPSGQNTTASPGRFWQLFQFTWKYRRTWRENRNGNTRRKQCYHCKRAVMRPK